MKDARHTMKLYTVVSYLYETSDKTELVTKNRSVPGTDGKKLTTEGHIRRHDQSMVMEIFHILIITMLK